MRQLGHRPVPHLTVRRYRNPKQLEETIQHLHDEAAVREAFILAGGAVPAGVRKDSLDAMGGKEPAAPLCAPHHMALGALDRTIAELAGP